MFDAKLSLGNPLGKTPHGLFKILSIPWGLDVALALADGEDDDDGGLIGCGWSTGGLIPVWF